MTVQVGFDAKKFNPRFIEPKPLTVISKHFARAIICPPISFLQLLPARLQSPVSIPDVFTTLRIAGVASVRAVAKLSWRSTMCEEFENTLSWTDAAAETHTERIDVTAIMSLSTIQKGSYEDQD